MAEIKDPENTIIMTLKDGEVVIELLAEVAPKHAERIQALSRFIRGHDPRVRDDSVNSAAAAARPTGRAPTAATAR